MRILFKPVALTLSILLILSLSACNSGGISGTGSGSAKYTYRFLPSKLIIDLPNNLLITQPDVTRPTSPLSIFQEIALISVKQQNLENQLDIIFIDAAFEQIKGFCKKKTIDEGCQIPSGEIYFTFTQAMANTQRDLVFAKWQAEGRTQHVINEGLADLDSYHQGIIGDKIPLDATEFTRLDGLPYDYNVKQLRGSIFTVLSERVTWSLSWTSDKTSAQIFTESRLPDQSHGIFYSFYQERADGSSMTTRSMTETGTTSTTKLSIKERLDDEQGVNMRALVLDTSADDTPLLYNLEGIANSSGGYAITHVEQPTLGGGFNTRETIDSTGAPLDYEICVFGSDRAICDDNKNWGVSQNFTPQEDISDSAFFTLYNAIEDFSLSLGQTDLKVKNLPETTYSFVIAGQGFPLKQEALVCSGQRSAGEVLLQCGIDAAILLQMDLNIFEEVIERGIIHYKLIDNATITSQNF